VLKVDSIAMPEDMGAFDLERLRKFLDRPASPMEITFSGKRFDVVEWENDGLVGIGYSVIWDYVGVANRPMIEEYVQALPEEERDEYRRHVAESKPSVHRNWTLAYGTRMANAWYRSPHSDYVPADIVDCEEIVRSIRFG